MLKNRKTSRGRCGETAIVSRCRAEALERRVLLDATMVAGLPQQPASSFPINFTVSGGKLYFSADAGGFGNELWVTDGTVAGTHLVKDVNPGIASSNPGDLTDVNGTLYFIAADATGQQRLFRTDGTASGTRQIDFPAINPEDLSNIGGTLYFGAQGAPGPDGDGELWKSDGTDAGTVLLKQINPPPYGALDPGSFTDINGTAFFWNDYHAVPTLWKSDGTPGGTTTVPGAPAGGGPLVALNGKAYFLVENPPSGSFTHTWSLWKSDGASCTEVQALGQTDFGDSVATPINVNGTLYFGIGFRLWRSDGTAAGTTVVEDFGGGTGGINGLVANQGGMLWFSVSFGDIRGVNDQQLWRSDGTAAGTVLVADNVGIVGTPTAVDDKLFFLQADHVGNLYNGFDLWATDGTQQGTVDLGPAPASIQVAGFKPLAGFDHRLFFSQRSASAGTELWSSDGTVAGTGLFDDLAPGTTTALGQQGPPTPYTGTSLAAAGHTLFFTTAEIGSAMAQGSQWLDLWKTDPSSTNAVDLDASSGPFQTVTQLAPSGESTFFTEFENLGGLVGVSDGTPAGTRAIDMRNYVSDPIVLHGSLLFLTPQALWTMDSHASSVQTLSPSGLQWISDLTIAGTTAFFLGGHSFNEVQLWKTDGTVTGTVPVATLPDNSGPFGLTAVSGTLLFLRNTATGLELWKSDGIDTGTARVKSFGAVPAGQFNYSSPPLPRLALDNTLYFALDDGVHGSELWKSDGTDAGTQMVKDINPGPGGSDPQWLTAYNGRLYFSADDGSDGRELWTSDGTPQGTHMVADINPGAGSSNPTWLTAAGGLLYFNAYRPDVGNELFSTDGTPAGTRLALDLYPGVGSSDPQNLTYVDGTLYFVASDPTHQGELWKLPVGTPVVTLDFSYFVTLARNYGQSGTLATGDLNGDGEVNFDDLVILARNYGHPFSPALSQTEGQAPTASIGHELLPKRSRHAQRPRGTAAFGPELVGVSTLLPSG